VNGIITLQSGAPFTANLGTDQANIGSGPAQRPNVNCDPNAGAAGTAAQWFNTSCFTLPAAYTFGNAGRNDVVGPGYADVVGGGARLELRWEIFNLFNHANFDVPNRTFGTANFGRIFSAEPARQMQLGAKLLF